MTRMLDMSVRVFDNVPCQLASAHANTNRNEAAYRRELVERRRALMPRRSAFLAKWTRNSIAGTGQVWT